MHGIFVTRIKLTVHNPGPGRHPLHISGPDNTGATLAVFDPHSMGRFEM